MLPRILKILNNMISCTSLDVTEENFKGNFTLVP
jgi:hypothetical protein